MSRRAASPAESSSDSGSSQSPDSDLRMFEMEEGGEQRMHNLAAATAKKKTKRGRFSAAFASSASSHKLSILTQAASATATATAAVKSAASDGAVAMEGVKTALPKGKSVNRIALLLESESKPFESEISHERNTLALLTTTTPLVAMTASASATAATPASAGSIITANIMHTPEDSSPLGTHSFTTTTPAAAAIETSAHPSSSAIGLEFIARPLPIPANQIKDPKQYVSHSSRLNPENGAFARNHDQITHSPSLSPVLRAGSMSPSIERKGKRKLSFDDRYEPYKRRLPPSPSAFSALSHSNHSSSNLFSLTPPAAFHTPPPVQGGGLGSPMMLTTSASALSINGLAMSALAAGGSGGRARSLSASSCGSAAMSIVSAAAGGGASISSPIATGSLWSGGGGGFGGAAYGNGAGGLLGNPFVNGVAGNGFGSASTATGTGSGNVGVGSSIIRPGSPRIGLLAAAVQGAAVQAQQAAAAAAAIHQQQQQQQHASGAIQMPVPMQHVQMQGASGGSPVRGGGLGQMLNITGAQGSLMKMSLS